jgi:hypothetical protein
MSDPQKAQSPGGAGQSANETADTQILGQLLEISKRETTLIAHFALAGHAVHRLPDGGYLVSRWGQSRHCPDLHALANFAKQTGVTR